MRRMERKRLLRAEKIQTLEQVEFTAKNFMAKFDYKGKYNPKGNLIRLTELSRVLANQKRGW